MSKEEQSQATEHVVVARELSRRFGNHLAVNKLSFAVPRGSVFALLGRNGAGKTTTLKMLLGLVLPTSGQSEVLSENSMTLDPETRGRIGYMAEGCALFDWMTVKESTDFQSKFYPSFNRPLCSAITDSFRLRDEQKVRTLSRGQRAGLNLALVLAAEPELLILDDPALGLDPVARRLLLEAMVYFAQKRGCTIVLSSHLLADVERVSDHVAIVDGGRMLACCNVSALQDGVQQYALRFDEMPEALPQLANVLCTQRTSEEWRVTVVASGENEKHQARAQLDGIGAATIESVAMTFEDAVIAFLGHRGTTQFAFPEAQL